MMYYNQLETGRRIQKLRRERYLTQEELAIKLNISDRHLRNLERGELKLISILLDNELITADTYHKVLSRYSA